MLFYLYGFNDLCREKIDMNIADIRKDYQQKTLSEKEVKKTPVEQFSQWWDEVMQSDIEEANAMTLATASVNGVPAARVVLLKGFDEKGFVFFTNYDSYKGMQLAENPRACLVFFWKELERQVRICGAVTKVSEEESTAYFNSRPAGSRIGAWASPQSALITDRTILDKNVIAYTKKFGSNIPKPQHWGGYLVKPESIEFWQGRSSRLHDRLLYTLQESSWWKIERLAP